MGISPTFKTAQPTEVWTVQLVPDSGIFPVSGLVSGSFSLLIHNLETGREVTGQGTFSAITAAVTITSGGVTTIISPASVEYRVAIADVVLGHYRLYVLVTLSDGTIKPFLIEEDWEVLPL